MYAHTHAHARTHARTAIFNINNHAEIIYIIGKDISYLDNLLSTMQSQPSTRMLAISSTFGVGHRFFPKGF